MTAAIACLGGVIVKVRDPDATATFLRDALGFDAREQGGAGWAIVCDGDYGPLAQIAADPRSSGQP